MPSTYFTRSGLPNQQYVICSNGSSVIKFDSNFGGIAIPWQYPISGTMSDLIDPFGGTGFQFVIDQGQDLTQAGANGLTQLQIARTGIDTGAVLYYKNYYVRESTDGFPTGNVSLDIYKLVGFFPDFWVSIDAIDDSVPTNSGGGTQQPGTSGSPINGGWITGYSYPTYAVAPFNSNTWGAPVFFAPYSTYTSGIFMEGNENIPTTVAWNQRLRFIPYGRVAFRVKVSLSNASDDAFGGIMFRRSVPTGSGSYTMDNVYNARGYSLNVNRNGDIQLIYSNGSGGQTAIWTYSGTTATRASVQNSFGYGIQLELRTVNYDSSYVEIWADGNLLTGTIESPGWNIPSEYLFADADAQHTGFIAYTTNAQQRVSGQTNFVSFRDREIFNVGTETTYTIAPNSDGSINTTLVHQPAGGVGGTITLYTVTQTAYTANNSYLDNAATESPLGTFNNGPSSSGLANYLGTIYGASSPQFALLYSGHYDGAIARNANVGLACQPTGLTITGAPSGYTQAPHGQVQARAVNGSTGNLAINALQYISSYGVGPWNLGSVTLEATWYPFLAH